jgi:hypothetical protein
VLDVERWAELRREYFVRQAPIKELARRYGIDRNTVRRALRSDEPPRYRRPPRSSKLEPFKEEIHALLGRDPKLSGVRVRELIEPLGFDGGKSIVDDYLREHRRWFIGGDSGLCRYLAGCREDRVLPDTSVGIQRQDADRAWFRPGCDPAAQGDLGSRHYDRGCRARWPGDCRGSRRRVPSVPRAGHSGWRASAHCQTTSVRSSSSWMSAGSDAASFTSTTA